MSKAAKHSAYLIAAYFATAVMNYLFGVTLSWFFSPAEFGVLGVAQSLLLLLALAVGSGFAWSAAYEFASEGATEITRRRFRTAFAANLILGVLLSLGIWLLYGLGVLDLGPAYTWLVPLIGLTVVSLALRAVSNGVMRGLYRFGPLALNLTAEVVIKSLLGLALVQLGWGVFGVLVGFAAGAGVTLVHSLLVVRKERLFTGKGWMDVRVIRITLPLFIGLLGTALMLNLDVLGLKLLSPPGVGDVRSGYYQAAVILARTPVFLAQALTMVLFSYVAGAKRLSAIGETQEVDNVRTALRVWFRFLLPAGLVLIFAPKQALGLFFPLAYQQSALTLQLAAAGCLLLALFSLLIGVFQAQGKRRRPALLAGVGTFAQLVTLWLLVPRLGAVGAALSLVAAGGLTLLGLLPYLQPANEAIRAAHRGAGLIRWSVRLSVPLIALILPLVIFPDADRATTAGLFVLAGLAYSLTLYLVHVDSRSWQPRPDVWLSQFVQLVFGR